MSKLGISSAQLWLLIVKEHEPPRAHLGVYSPIVCYQELLPCAKNEVKEISAEAGFEPAT